MKNSLKKHLISLIMLVEGDAPRKHDPGTQRQKTPQKFKVFEDEGRVFEF